MTLRGTLNNGVVVLDQAAPWPEGTRVEVVADTPERKLTLSEKLLRHAGTVPDLPADMAAQTLEQRFDRRQDAATESGQPEARARFERHFGAIDLRHPSGADNESIDADLARIYGDAGEGA